MAFQSGNMLSIAMPCAANPILHLPSQDENGAAQAWRVYKRVFDTLLLTQSGMFPQLVHLLKLHNLADVLLRAVPLSIDLLHGENLLLLSHHQVGVRLIRGLRLTDSTSCFVHVLYPELYRGGYHRGGALSIPEEIVGYQLQRGSHALVITFLL